MSTACLLAEEEGAASISLAILTMARSLGLRTVAEGVENEAQLAFFRKNFCDAVQGIYLSGGCKAEQISTLLEASGTGQSPPPAAEQQWRYWRQQAGQPLPA